MWWLIEEKVKVLQPSFTPTPRPATAAPASDEAAELVEKMSVLESDTKAVEEYLNTLQIANDVVENECARLKAEIKKKTDWLSKADEENRKSGEALSTISADMNVLQEEKKVKEAELAAATT